MNEQDGGGARGLRCERVDEREGGWASGWRGKRVEGQSGFGGHMRDINRELCSCGRKGW